MTALDYLAMVNGIAGQAPDWLGMGVIADALEEEGDHLAPAWRVLAAAKRWPAGNEIWADCIWRKATSIKQRPWYRLDSEFELWPRVWNRLPFQPWYSNFRSYDSCSAALILAAEATRMALAAGWRP